MGNKKIILSGESRKIIDELMVLLDFSRPKMVEFSLSKGLSIANGPTEIQSFDLSTKWEFGESIIDGSEYLLYKHLIINEQQRSLSEEEVSKYMGNYIELGCRKLKELMTNKSSIEDLRLALLK